MKMSKITLDKVTEIYFKLKDKLEVLETIAHLPPEHATKGDRYAYLPIGKTECNSFLWGKWNPNCIESKRPSIDEFIAMYKIEIVK